MRHLATRVALLLGLLGRPDLATAKTPPAANRVLDLAVELGPITGSPSTPACTRR
jgi:hypothetical protein